MVEIDEDGTIHERKPFDTFSSVSDVSDMITYLNSVAANRYVLTGVKGEGSTELNNNGGSYTAL